MADYPSTATDFTCWTRPRFAEMAGALGSGPVHADADFFRDLSDTFGLATDLARDAGGLLRATQTGPATDAAGTHFDVLHASGMAGQSQALGAMLALADQGEVVSSARNKLLAAYEFAEADVPPGTQLSPHWEARYQAQLTAVRDAAVVYEDTTNGQYAGAFQSYPPPTQLAPDTAVAPAGTGGDGVGAIPGVPTGPGGGAGHPPAGSGASPGAGAGGVGPGVAGPGGAGAGTGGAGTGGSAAGPGGPLPPVGGPPVAGGGAVRPGGAPGATRPGGVAGGRGAAPGPGHPGGAPRPVAVLPGTGPRPPAFPGERPASGPGGGLRPGTTGGPSTGWRPGEPWSGRVASEPAPVRGGEPG
ncbi:MAG: hypothetical protein ACT4RN_21790, partial [Pseudonocardia sp.]